MTLIWCRTVTVGYQPHIACVFATRPPWCLNTHVLKTTNLHPPWCKLLHVWKEDELMALSTCMFNSQAFNRYLTLCRHNFHMFFMRRIQLKDAGNGNLGIYSIKLHDNGTHQPKESTLFQSSLKSKTRLQLPLNLFRIISWFNVLRVNCFAVLSCSTVIAWMNVYTSTV